LKNEYHISLCNGIGFGYWYWHDTMISGIG